MNYQTIQDFTNAMRDAGIETNAAIIDDGQLQRAHVVGDKSGTKNLAYKLHNDDRPSGYFHYWCKGITGTWSSTGKPFKLSFADLQQIKHDKIQRELVKAENYAIAANKAMMTWQQCTPVVTHPYLTKKSVTAHSARLSGNELVIALWTEKRTLSTLQFISPNGDKRFMSGGKKAGCFAVIGKHHAPTDKILICEGFATGASLHDDSGHFVVCAMDSGNLEPVARVIRRLFKSAQIVICGDNDASGVGQKAAKHAAIACGGAYLIPPIEGIDFNDFLTMAGV